MTASSPALPDIFVDSSDSSEGRHRPRMDATRLRWSLDLVCPRDWTSDIDALGAGFFVTAPSLAIADPGARPVFCRLYRDGIVAGIGLAGLRGCALSATPRHYRFASPPAISASVDRTEGIALLTRELARRGAAEVAFGSFDSDHVLESGRPGRAREEFPVPLHDSEEARLARCAPTHRRHIRAGIRAGWTAAPLTADDAATTLHAVQAAAIERVGDRDEGRRPLPPEALRFPVDTPSFAPSGMRTFAAYEGDSLLAAVLLGWAGRRVYYLIGGSTELGYARSAAAWLHWILMERFQRLGFQIYNLGGAPQTARDPDDPGHGLHRFKAGFGASPVACRGASWAMRPFHLRRDTLVRALAGYVRRGAA